MRKLSELYSILYTYWIGDKRWYKSGICSAISDLVYYKFITKAEAFAISENLEKNKPTQSVNSCFYFDVDYIGGRYWWRGFETKQRDLFILHLKQLAEMNEKNDETGSITPDNPLQETI